MRVLVTSAYPDPEPITSFMRLVNRDRFQVHTLADEPEEADIILFVENSHYTDDPNFRILRRHPLVRKYREKCFMYNEHDRPWCVLPGVYFSMPRNRIDPARQRPCGFVREINPYIEYSDPGKTESRYLFSFTGRRYPGVRTRILALDHPRACIRDTSEFSAYAVENSAESRINHHETFAETLAQSKFVLCPRGVATSSLRPFEAMKAGRVPVIISDQYALPIGPAWDSFSVFVAERDIDGIPGVLERLESRSLEMGVTARREWEEWLSPEVLFHRMIEDVIAIRESRRIPEAIAQRIPQLAYIDWRTRAALRPVRDRLRSLSTRT